MRIQAWDSVFVRARRTDVHPILADVAGYGRWWPAASSRDLGTRVAVTLTPPGIARRTQRFTVAVTKERPAKGIRMRYTGDLAGDAEWYYLDEPAGTVVHYLLTAEVTDRAWRRRLTDHRAAIRQGLDTVKDRLEDGRIPGTEPDPRLLDDQQAAIAEFRAAVAAHARATRGQ